MGFRRAPHRDGMCCVSCSQFLIILSYAAVCAFLYGSWVLYGSLGGVEDMVGEVHHKPEYLVQGSHTSKGRRPPVMRELDIAQSFPRGLVLPESPTDLEFIGLQYWHDREAQHADSDAFVRSLELVGGGSGFHPLLWHMQDGARISAYPLCVMVRTDGLTPDAWLSAESVLLQFPDQPVHVLMPYSAPNALITQAFADLTGQSIQVETFVDETGALSPFAEAVLLALAQHVLALCGPGKNSKLCPNKGVGEVETRCVAVMEHTLHGVLESQLRTEDTRANTHTAVNVQTVRVSAQFARDIADILPTVTDIPTERQRTVQWKSLGQTFTEPAGRSTRSRPVMGANGSRGRLMLHWLVQVLAVLSERCGHILPTDSIYRERLHPSALRVEVALPETDMSLSGLTGDWRTPGHPLEWYGVLFDREDGSEKVVRQRLHVAVGVLCEWLYPTEVDDTHTTIDKSKPVGPQMYAQLIDEVAVRMGRPVGSSSAPRGLLDTATISHMSMRLFAEEELDEFFVDYTRLRGRMTLPIPAAMQEIVRANGDFIELQSVVRGEGTRMAVMCQDARLTCSLPPFLLFPQHNTDQTAGGTGVERHRHCGRWTTNANGERLRYWGSSSWSLAELDEFGSKRVDVGVIHAYIQQPHTLMQRWVHPVPSCKEWGVSVDTADRLVALQRSLYGLHPVDVWLLSRHCAGQSVTDNALATVQRGLAKASSPHFLVNTRKVVRKSIVRGGRTSLQTVAVSSPVPSMRIVHPGVWLADPVVMSRAEGSYSLNELRSIPLPLRVSDCMYAYREWYYPEDVDKKYPQRMQYELLTFIDPRASPDRIQVPANTLAPEFVAVLQSHQALGGGGRELLAALTGRENTVKTKAPVDNTQDTEFYAGSVRFQMSDLSPDSEKTHTPVAEIFVSPDFAHSQGLRLVDVEGRRRPADTRQAMLLLKSQSSSNEVSREGTVWQINHRLSRVSINVIVAVQRVLGVDSAVPWAWWSAGRLMAVNSNGNTPVVDEKGIQPRYFGCMGLGVQTFMDAIHDKATDFHTSDTLACSKGRDRKDLQPHIVACPCAAGCHSRLPNPPMSHAAHHMSQSQLNNLLANPVVPLDAADKKPPLFNHSCPVLQDSFLLPGIDAQTQINHQRNMLRESVRKGWGAFEDTVADGPIPSTARAPSPLTMEYSKKGNRQVAVDTLFLPIHALVTVVAFPNARLPVRHTFLQGGVASLWQPSPRFQRAIEQFSGRLGGEHAVPAPDSSAVPAIWTEPPALRHLLKDWLRVQFNTQDVSGSWADMWFHSSERNDKPDAVLKCESGELEKALASEALGLEGAGLRRVRDYYLSLRQQLASIPVIIPVFVDRGTVDLESVAGPLVGLMKRDENVMVLPVRLSLITASVLSCAQQSRGWQAGWDVRTAELGQEYENAGANAKIALQNEGFLDFLTLVMTRQLYAWYVRGINLAREAVGTPYVYMDRITAHHDASSLKQDLRFMLPRAMLTLPVIKQYSSGYFNVESAARAAYVGSLLFHAATISEGQRLWKEQLQSRVKIMRRKNELAPRDQALDAHRLRALEQQILSQPLNHTSVPLSAERTGFLPDLIAQVTTQSLVSAGVAAATVDSDQWASALRMDDLSHSFLQQFGRLTSEGFTTHMDMFPADIITVERGSRDIRFNGRSLANPTRLPGGHVWNARRSGLFFPLTKEGSRPFASQRNPAPLGGGKSAKTQGQANLGNWIVLGSKDGESTAGAGGGKTPPQQAYALRAPTWVRQVMRRVYTLPEPSPTLRKKIKLEMEWQERHSDTPTPSPTRDAAGVFTVDRDDLSQYVASHGCRTVDWFLSQPPAAANVETQAGSAVERALRGGEYVFLSAAASAGELPEVHEVSATQMCADKLTVRQYRAELDLSGGVLSRNGCVGEGSLPQSDALCAARSGVMMRVDLPRFRTDRGSHYMLQFFIEQRRGRKISMVCDIT